VTASQHLLSPPSWSAYDLVEDCPQIGIPESPWASGPVVFPSMISFTHAARGTFRHSLRNRVRSGDECSGGKMWSMGLVHPIAWQVAHGVEKSARLRGGFRAEGFGMIA